MGWASAGAIFDPVARKLIESGASDEVVTAVCAELIREMCNSDWDTLDESIDQFGDQPAVMAAFRAAAPDWMEDIEVPASPAPDGAKTTDGFGPGGQQ